MIEPRPRKRYQLPVDPTVAWNTPEPDATAMLAQCRRLLAVFRQLPTKAWTAAASFLTDVEAKVKAVAERLESGETPQSRWQASLDNWERAVRAWLPRDKKGGNHE